MEWLSAPDYWLSRLVFQRLLAGIYVVAFVSTLSQFRPLLGTDGLLPVSRFLRAVPFGRAPSIFHPHYSDGFALAVAWTGVVQRRGSWPSSWANARTAPPAAPLAGARGSRRCRLRLDPLGVEALAQEQLTAEPALRALGHHDLLALRRLPAALRGDGEHVLLDGQVDARRVDIVGAPSAIFFYNHEPTLFPIGEGNPCGRTCVP